MASPLRSLRSHVLHGLNRENKKLSSCLKSQGKSITIWCVPILDLCQVCSNYIPGAKLPHAGYHMYFIGTYRENIRQSGGFWNH